MGTLKMLPAQSVLSTRPFLPGQQSPQRKERRAVNQRFLHRPARRLRSYSAFPATFRTTCQIIPRWQTLSSARPTSIWRPKSSVTSPRSKASPTTSSGSPSSWRVRSRSRIATSVLLHPRSNLPSQNIFRNIYPLTGRHLEVAARVRPFATS